MHDDEKACYSAWWILSNFTVIKGELPLEIAIFALVYRVAGIKILDPALGSEGNFYH